MTAASILTGVMEKIGGKFSATTLTGLELWAQSEGTPDSWNNPLATTLSCCGGTDVNSSGVKSYPTENDGIDATYNTLTGGGYDAVVTAIRDNQSLTDLWTAINASPWCSGCQNGDYPVALYDYIHGGGKQPGGPGGSPPPPPAGPPPPGVQDNHDAANNAWDSLATALTSGSQAQWRRYNDLLTSFRGQLNR